MDKFSRTTEIDTAGVLNAIEEDTPKKSRRGNIIALAICILVAIFIWAYVMDTDPEIIEQEFKNVTVTFENENYNYTVTTQVNVVIKGTRNKVVDISKSDIILVARVGDIQAPGEYMIPLMCDSIGSVTIIPNVQDVLVKATEK